LQISPNGFKIRIEVILPLARKPWVAQQDQRGTDIGG